MDNGFATIRIEWDDSANDFDLEIYRDANGDGDLDDVNEDNEPENEPISSSASGAPPSSRPRSGPTRAPGNYVARVVNYAGADLRPQRHLRGPDPFSPAHRDWTLTCETRPARCVPRSSC